MVLAGGRHTSQLQFVRTWGGWKAAFRSSMPRAGRARATPSAFEALFLYVLLLEAKSHLFEHRGQMMTLVTLITLITNGSTLTSTKMIYSILTSYNDTKL